MADEVRDRLLQELDDTRDLGLFKVEHRIAGAQGAHVQLAGGRRVLNMCANDYLNLSSHPDVVAAAAQALKEWGYGMSSVRFICGTQVVHTRLEETIAAFLGMEAAILYSSCFDANGGLFETLLGPEDAIVSDALNHASVIDGIRLCKAQRHRYRNCDMADLQEKLEEARGARTTLIATDGVFSMDGVIAPLADICDLAERYGALVMVDDSHALGVLGERGRGTPEHHGVGKRVDIVTGTLGKALGGASGGFTCSSREVVELLRQRSRPYLFSNSLAPMIASASITAIEVAGRSQDLRARLRRNAQHFRAAVEAAGFATRGAGHPIIPVMVGEAADAQQIAAGLFELGVYAVGFFYPVVPHGEARIRVQVSAQHEIADLDFAVEQLAAVRAGIATGRSRA
ncbi:MAG TPA: glycine C-acetyltransferase [Thermoleophilia bacterium]|nr:glycine C-acetyltransferase [Thermoleophilia bacterium]